MAKWSRARPVVTASPFLTVVDSVPEWDASWGFPFDIQAFASGIHLEIRSRVTFLVGENGTGKSTLW
jgi:predicted ATPase